MADVTAEQFVHQLKSAYDAAPAGKKQALPPGFWTNLLAKLLAAAGTLPQLMATVAEILALFGIVLPAPVPTPPPLPAGA